MLFDFEKFSRIASSLYQDGDGPYSLEDILMVFRCYFETYERRMGHPHPPIRATQIRRIIQEMPWARPENKGCYGGDIDPETYLEIIQRHFETKYRSCDYNINHFFAGRTREMRWYEWYCGKEEDIKNEL